MQRLHRYPHSALRAVGHTHCRRAGLWLALVLITSLPAHAAPPGAQFIPSASIDVQRLNTWVQATGDSRYMPFAIIDKKQARIFVFDAQARLQGSSPVLLGAAIGDDTVPGIGDRRIADILPHERTTPAGRFVAEPGMNTKGDDIIWVDYDAAVSLHRVRANDRSERRLQRLASPTPDDNRISYGCINVPARFYDRVLQPAMAVQAVVYVLPETRSPGAVFGFQDAATQPGQGF
ncbi:MAG: hypothetical protein Q7T87_17980 [Polaromonas sp.]|nr:hypothetical protein [Polaromonas sp.]